MTAFREDKVKSVHSNRTTCGSQFLTDNLKTKLSARLDVYLAETVAPPTSSRLMNRKWSNCGVRQNERIGIDVFHGCSGEENLFLRGINHIRIAAQIAAPAD